MVEGSENNLSNAWLFEAKDGRILKETFQEYLTSHCVNTKKRNSINISIQRMTLIAQKMLENLKIIFKEDNQCMKKQNVS